MLKFLVVFLLLQPFYALADIVPDYPPQRCAKHPELAKYAHLSFNQGKTVDCLAGEPEPPNVRAAKSSRVMCPLITRKFFPNGIGFVVIDYLGDRPDYEGRSRKNCPMLIRDGKSASGELDFSTFTGKELYIEPSYDHNGRMALSRKMYYLNGKWDGLSEAYDLKSGRVRGRYLYRNGLEVPSK